MTQDNQSGIALDGAIQEVISMLEEGRERLSAMAGTIRAEGERLVSQAAELRQQLAARAELAAGLATRAEAARAQLDAAIGQGLRAEALSAALEAWADARAAAVAAGEAAAAAEAGAGALEACLPRLDAAAGDGSASAARLEESGKRLAAMFRELVAKMESAQQSRGLGLHVIRAQEEERRRLAREIHDGPAQLLNSVVLRINVCQKLFETDQQRLYEELNQLKDLVRLSLQDVRKIIFDLRPMALDDLGLVPALRQFLKDYQARTGIETEFSVFGNERRFDSAFEVAMFRLVQEGLSNVYKHAGATRVWVKVELTGGRDIRLTVRDNGSGFDAAQLGRIQGTKFGLVGMRERAELLGGSMEIISAPGQGSRLNFAFPVVD